MVPDFQIFKIPPKKCTASTCESPNKKRKKSEEVEILKEVKDFLMYVIVYSPDSLKLGFKCTRRLELRILRPILNW